MTMMDKCSVRTDNVADTSARPPLCVRACLVWSGVGSAYARMRTPNLARITG